jgi:hypothetical protein
MKKYDLTSYNTEDYVNSRMITILNQNKEDDKNNKI